MNSRYQLNTLYVYLTRDCNLHCKHCWQSAGEGAFEDRLFQQPDILIKTLYQAKKIGLRLLKISGGEPFLKRELLNMILSFSEKNNVDSVIETNGTLINEQDLPMLKAANALVGVSLDYLDNKKMDAFREGRGLLKKVSNAIKMLVNAGIEVQVIMALTRENVSIIEDMVGFCKAEGVSDLKINPVSPSGRAKKMLESQIILDPEYP
jgi:MoaA/NifB/PqqE/SkfB family radical SAM enzyme